MIIVSDTSPINYLVLMGDVGILELLFQRVIIPPAVFQEMQHPKTPQPVKDWINNAPDWLEVKHADASLFTPIFRKRSPSYMTSVQPPLMGNQGMSQKTYLVHLTSFEEYS